MQPELPRTSLNGSALVGLLAQWALVDRPSAPPSFVEGLGHWLGWKDAIPLSAALQASLVPLGAAGASAGTPSAVAQQLTRVRQSLVSAISDDGSTAREDGSSFVPFRRRYFGLQQSMAAAIGPLRADVRAATAQRSPALRRLAALDAVMADALAAREQTLLAVMPVLLEKHFSRLRQAPPAKPPGTPWLSVFRADMQRLLLAELELRLQPSLGLLDTLVEPLHAAPPVTPAVPLSIS